MSPSPPHLWSVVGAAHVDEQRQPSEHFDIIQLSWGEDDQLTKLRKTRQLFLQGASSLAQPAAVGLKPVRLTVSLRSGAWHCVIFNEVLLGIT